MHSHSYFRHGHFTGQSLNCCSRYGFSLWLSYMVISVGLVIGGAAVVGIGVGCESSGVGAIIRVGIRLKRSEDLSGFIQAGGRYMGFLLLRLICRADSTGSHKVSGRVGAPSCLQRGGALLAGNGGVGTWWLLTACSSFSRTATRWSNRADCTSGAIGIKRL